MSDGPAPAPPAGGFDEHLPRIAWLVQQALIHQAAARQVACQLADLGCIEPALLPRSGLPHLADLQERMVALEARAERAWGEVRRLGGRVADRELGFVDYPATVGGREVVLCWQLGEETADHWHERGEPCRERRPIETEPHG